MRLVYFGSGAFGLPTLKALAATHQLAAIVTQPDRPAGRGSRLTPTPIAAFAAELLPEIPLLKPERVNTLQTVEQIRAAGADAWVVIAFGQKLGQRLLEGVFAINLHASLLPRWRGAAPINAAILGGDTQTGNSVITLADRMDAGLILGQTFRDIPPLMTAGELHDLLAADGPALVDRVLSNHRAGTLSPKTQADELVTIAGKLSKQDDDIDFHQPADFLRREVHALTPWPGISVALIAAQASPTPAGEHAGERATGPLKALQTLKLLRVQAEATLPDAQHPPAGTLLDFAAGTVACRHGSVLRILEVQPPGKRAMPWADYARGAGRSVEAAMKAVGTSEIILMSAREAS